MVVFRWISVLAFLGLSGISVASGAELLRKSGQHIRLVSDAISAEDADTIVATFDAAVEQWKKFWDLGDGQTREFLVKAHVIGDLDRFRREGFVPPQVPDFPFGYALDDQVFVRVQPSQYYTRHLVLHEGIHSLAYECFGGAGSTWFQEGTAELLATHRGVGQNVTVNVVPKTRDEVRYWGRFKRMTQSRQEGTVPTLSAVMGYQPTLSGDVEAYSWSWAAAMMLTRYPEYRSLMIQSARAGDQAGLVFNERFRQKLSNEWPILEARWRVMARDLDYGFDWSREQLSLAMDDPMWDGQPINLKIAADRGWQSAGVRVPGGIKIGLAASGRVTLANEPKPWESEPAGITFQYAGGRPLGQLMVAVLPNAIEPDNKIVRPLRVEVVQDKVTLNIDAYSWLLFRVNDSVDQMSDNRGAYDLTLQVAR